MKNIKKLTLLTIFAATAFSIQPSDSSPLEIYYTWLENNRTNLANLRTEMNRKLILLKHYRKNGQSMKCTDPLIKRLTIAESYAKKIDPQFARHTVLRINKNNQKLSYITKDQAEGVIHAANVAPSKVRFDLSNCPSPEPLDKAIHEIRFSAKKYGIDPDQAEAATRKIYELD